MPLKLHGKEYMTVAERINLLLSQNEVTRYYSLNTEIVSSTYDSDRQEEVIIKATLTLGGQTFTGHAMEEKGNKGVNKTSHVENCETSAIGRALAAAGFHGSEYASADELVEALNKQAGGSQSSRPRPEPTQGNIVPKSDTGGFNGGYYDFLKQCATEKPRVGESQYRAILKEFGLEKANQIDKSKKSDMSGIINRLSKMKPVTNDLIFPLEINYLCSRHGEEVQSAVEKQMQAANKTLDDYKSDAEKQGLLDLVHISVQGVLAKS